jgi:hypothetical protein
VLRLTTGNLDSQDSPRPGLRGSHHPPSYSILCTSMWGFHPNDFLSQDSRNCQCWNLCNFGASSHCVKTFDWDEVWSKVVALVKSFSTACRTPLARKEIWSILNFYWLGVKLSNWLLALLLAITCVSDVQMGHASSL